MASRPSRSAFVLAALLGLLGPFPGLGGPAAADAPPKDEAAEATAAADRALRRLRSPLHDERREAVEALVGLLPGVRTRISAALPKAPWTVQVHLIEVLARDGDPESIRALLDHLVRTDETQAVMIRMFLVRDEVASKRLLASFRKDRRGFLQGAMAGARGLQRLNDLLLLLRRAEIEQKFLSRKSRSGSTGYYRGQYDLLKDPKLGAAYREEALDVVTGIALDEAVPIPGVYKSGVYRFLRPHHVDEVELDGMAVNAVAELCTPADRRILERLGIHLMILDAKRNGFYRELGALPAQGVAYDSKQYEETMVDWEDALGEYGDLLACMAIILPDSYVRQVDEFVVEMRGYGYPRRPRQPLGFIAALLIRIGRYRDAIAAYEEYMDSYWGSNVLSNYNLACAYSSWSQDDGASREERERRLAFALRYLEEAVAAGWSDVAWMNQDRDLDAIRDTQTYRDLAKQIEKSLEVPER